MSQKCTIKHQEAESSPKFAAYKTSGIRNHLPSSAMIKNSTILFLIILLSFSCKTSKPLKSDQTSEKKEKNKPANPNYRSSYTKLFDLIHTELELKPNWERKELYGRANIKLRPHFYSTDSLTLNARGMAIHSVELEQGDNLTPLSYKYENNKINIRLDHSYSSNDSLNIVVNYTAQPESLPKGGSSAIRKDKGLYFINADGLHPNKPKQIWTQGETESNSVWFPTIEDPGQKMTQEIYLTVDSSFKTLSNGLHLSSINNPDGTRTDYWKQSLALAPYLTMIAVSDFAIVKDQWNDIEVSYYIDKNYEPYAKMIFGKTTEMLDFFSKIFGQDYPWEKYSQAVVYDFVSGAMENNTAVVHGINMLQDPREHKDHNYEDIIAHELCHHWFGNLLTCESWANVTLNEGFASYGEYLWTEYKYGRDEADRFGKQDQDTYLRATKKGDQPLIRLHYENREDVYDAISYQKGARVLHMLRKYVGDQAFFIALKNYVQKHKFSSVEFHELRLEFEAVTGEDLNWFFNQWFLKEGKPSLDISTKWDKEKNELKIDLKQTQDLSKNPVYRLPMDVDFYFGSAIEKKRIVMDSLIQSFTFSFPEEPLLVNVDAEKMLLIEKKLDHKNNAEWIYQYYHAPLFLDRHEAIVAIGKDYRIRTPESQVIIKALSDKNPSIKLLALKYIREQASNAPEEVKGILKNIAENDSNSYVRSESYETLSEFYPYSENEEFFKAAIPDYSYLVEATVFSIIAEKNPELAIKLSETLEKDSSSIITSELAAFYSNHPRLDKLDFFRKLLNKSSRWSHARDVNYLGAYMKSQNLPIMREGSELLLQTGLNTESKHTINNCIASLIKLQNELDERSKALKKRPNQDDTDKQNNGKITGDDIDLSQINSLKLDIEQKIKALEKKSD